MAWSVQFEAEFDATGEGDAVLVPHGVKWWALQPKADGSVTNLSAFLEVSLDGGTTWSRVEEVVEADVDTGSGVALVIPTTGPNPAPMARVNCAALTLNTATSVTIVVFGTE
jgi:hypothetical protein